MEHTSGEVEVRKWKGTMFIYAVGIVNGDTLFGINHEGDGKRFRDLWNAFNGISTHDAMNIAQAAIHLHDNPGDLKYMKHGADMESALTGMLGWALHTVAQGFPESDKLPRGYDKWKATLSKLEGGK